MKDCLFINSKNSKIQSKISQRQSFGKVELNLVSTPPLECLRRRLSEDSLIWLSKCPRAPYFKALMKSFSTLPRWYFRQCRHSRNLIHCRERLSIHKLQKSSQKSLTWLGICSCQTPSLECFRRKLSEESLIWLSKCPKGKALHIYKLCWNHFNSSTVVFQAMRG